MPDQFDAIFARLRDILHKHASRMHIKEDKPGSYWLEGGIHPVRKMRLCVAGVKTGKAYVSYHLMGVYGAKSLHARMSPKLKARMQGKTCFNFKAVDEALFAELEELTPKSFAAFKKAGWLIEE